VAGRSAAAEAREAIAAIGPEALPYIGAAAGKESVFRSLYRRIYNGLPAALNRHLTRPKARGKPLSPTQTLSLFNVAIGQADAAAIPILSSVCASGNSVARHAALVSLLRFASQDPEAVFRVLRKALRDDDPRVRNQALIYLCEAARTDPRARSLLAERLEALGPDAPEWLRQKGGAALEPNRGDSREGSATR
jgi:hypothetical protein